tara:strand:+ start:2158 stop:2889 length:732 start_codon:yes stop_codon:yes gene_type:complete
MDKKKDLTKLVISMNCESGLSRRKYLNYDFDLIVGCKGDNLEDPFVKEVSEKMSLRYNISQNKKNGFIGNFASHLKALDYIIKNKLDKVVILEDDSIQATAIPEDLPTEPCLFSGQIAHPSNWSKDKAFKESGINKEIISTFKVGVNPIEYYKFRWSQINALYIPTSTSAEILLNKIRQHKKYKAYDLFLSQHQLIEKLYYPAVFKHHDFARQSQVSTDPGIIINYVKVDKGTLNLAYYTQTG